MRTAFLVIWYDNEKVLAKASALGWKDGEDGLLDTYRPEEDPRNEFTFRFNRRFYPFNAFRSLLGIGTNGEGPTYAGIYEGTWKHPTMDSHHD